MIGIAAASRSSPKSHSVDAPSLQGGCERHGAATQQVAVPCVPAGRHVAIDGLRGFLALGVLFHHALFRFNLATTGRWVIADTAFYTLLGQVAVMTFFMITGFLFWDRVQQGTTDWRHFYGARVRR